MPQQQQGTNKLEVGADERIKLQQNNFVQHKKQQITMQNMNSIVNEIRKIKEIQSQIISYQNSQMQKLQRNNYLLLYKIKSIGCSLNIQKANFQKSVNFQNNLMKQVISLRSSIQEEKLKQEQKDQKFQDFLRKFLTPKKMKKNEKKKKEMPQQKKSTLHPLITCANDTIYPIDELQILSEFQEFKNKTGDKEAPYTSMGQLFSKVEDTSQEVPLKLQKEEQKLNKKSNA